MNLIKLVQNLLVFCLIRVGFVFMRAGDDCGRIMRLRLGFSLGHRSLKKTRLMKSFIEQNAESCAHTHRAVSMCQKYLQIGLILKNIRVNSYDLTMFYSVIFFEINILVQFFGKSNNMRGDQLIRQERHFPYHSSHW